MLTRTETGRKSVPYRMIASVPSVVTFMLYFFIVVSIFSVLGMQLFGGALDKLVVRAVSGLFFFFHLEPHSAIMHGLCIMHFK